VKAAVDELKTAAIKTAVRQQMPAFRQRPGIQLREVSSGTGRRPIGLMSRNQSGRLDFSRKSSLM